MGQSLTSKSVSGGVCYMVDGTKSAKYKIDMMSVDSFDYFTAK